MDTADRQTGPRRPETAVDAARRLPAPPPRPIADTPTLIQDEQEVFARCEAAIETLKVAFWAAGKALEVIREGRLYRATHPTFEDYVEERWGMHRNYAGKLIRTWRIAEAVFEQSSNTLVPIGTKINQAQVWELVPTAETHGPQAAALVYRTVLDVDDVPITAAILKGAAAALPDGQWDAQRAEKEVRAYLAGLTAGEYDEMVAVSARPPSLRSTSRALRRFADHHGVDALGSLLRDELDDEQTIEVTVSAASSMAPGRIDDLMRALAGLRSRSEQ